ncbi:HD domain-containing phosphohydrolase [Vampirovibrio sp.]|uniref:HD domain-containing phosphohydrolase n=1 Tax=Vampirovibrio sp. TaxID=2717857 RepID=UPI003593C1B7
MGVFSEVAERFRGPETPQRVRHNQGKLPSINDLMVATSKAMDLLEGRPMRTGLKVAVIAGSIAKLMALPGREVASIVYAALLHDIGLARMVSDIYPHLPPGMTEKQLFQSHQLVNARIIGSPHERPFSGDLYNIFHQHPLAAREFIAKVHLSDDVADVIATHHELCDGSGYPFGLTEEQIPIGGRILAFADVVEGVLENCTKEVSGLTSRRLALENFMEIKTPGRFDQSVVQVFREMITVNEDFLRMIASLEVETMVRSLLPERTMLMGGSTLLSIVGAMGALSDSLMPLYKGGRSRRIADFATSLAESLGIHREQCGELAMAGMLIDIGHLGTPIHLLMKNGPLTADERSIIRDHPVAGQEVLKSVPGFDNIALWVSEHHERMNGKGYPANRKGFEISIGGRILALADVFDALTSHRPYRTHAHEPMDALPVIGQGRMTLYDNQLVNLLRKVVLSSEVLIR